MGFNRSSLTAEWYRTGIRIETRALPALPVQTTQQESLSRFISIALMSIVILAWGINWSVGKVVLDYLPPVWATALRTIPACVAVWLLCALTGQTKVPAKSDIPIIFNVGLLHMAAFTVLATIGMQYVPAGKSVVLAYTTPLWVLPAAWLLLNEALPRQRILGVVIGMAGLALLLQPSALDWHDPDILYGHGLILGAALCWAICIVYNRAHKSTASTLQLLPWQILLAAVVQLALALMLEGMPEIEWSWRLLGLLAYGSLIGTVLAYWAMNSVSRRLSASVVSLASLGVPVVGLFSSALILGEALSTQLLVGTTLIVGGVVLAMLSRLGKED
ncbi:DMT family transporter [Alcaligenaceae bacterium]|nr:DMT family transporter [Alcaligenaceae bacterium]